MAYCDDVRNFTTRRRNILYLMHRFLMDNGYYSSAEAIKSEAKLTEDFELCDNIDLDSIYLEYANYYNMRFGKYPKFLKKAKSLIKVELPQSGTNLSPLTTVTSSSAANVKGRKSLMTVRPQQQQQPHGERDNLTNFQSGLGNCAMTTTFLQQEQIRKLQITAKKMDIDTNDMLRQQHQAQKHNGVLADIEHGHSSDDALFSSLDWQQLGQLVKTTIMRDDIKLTWSEICGNQHAIEVIKEAVVTPIQYPQLFMHGLKPWRSVLLHGPPGSGKTLLAKTLYAETQSLVTFFNITSSILISKWRGESEKILRVLFNLAERRAPSIIFFDEIDGITSKRDRPTDHESSKRLKNELLQLLDGMEYTLTGVFILASTNMPWEIDEAFLRRFEKKLLVQLPNIQERTKLISKKLPPTLSATPEKIQKLANLSENFTGDEIRLACKEIAMQNIRRVTCVTEGDIELSLEQAFERTKPISLKLMPKHEEWQLQHGS